MPISQSDDGKELIATSDKISIKVPSNTSTRITNIGLIAIILTILLIGIVIMMLFERYLAPYLANKILLRVILLGILINICIIIFLVFSFSKVSFAVGPRGSQGIRGVRGPSGENSNINKCSKQTKTITKEKNDRIRAKTIVVQKPAIVLD